MKKLLASSLSLVAFLLVAHPASAKVGLRMRELGSVANSSTLPTWLADNVVVTPQASAPAPATPVVETSVAPTQTVVPAPGPTKVVHAEVEGPHNYMTTIAVSALMGAVAGALVGGAVYYLGDRNNGRNIAYWAAGGVLVGTGVGVAQILVQENQVNRATSLNKLPTDPAPTFRLALLRTTF